jgi:hypothetical protein
MRYPPSPTVVPVPRGSFGRVQGRPVTA